MDYAEGKRVAGLHQEQGQLEQITGGTDAARLCAARARARLEAARLADDEGRGVILTLHDLDAALRVADRVIVLADGRVLADAPPREALSPEVLKRAYGVEARTLEGARGPVLEMVGRAR